MAQVGKEGGLGLRFVTQFYFYHRLIKSYLDYFKSISIISCIYLMKLINYF